MPAKPARPAVARLAAVPAVAALLLAPAVASAADAEAGAEVSAIPSFTQAFVPALFTLLVFSLLVALLGKYAWGPIAEGLSKREDKIRADVEGAERARADAERSRAENQRQLDAAEDRVRDLLAQAQADGQQLATRIRMQAQEEAEEIKEKAMRDIEQSRRDAVESVREEAASLAVMVAEKILRREVTAEDQQRLVDASLDELEKADLQTA